MAQRVWRKKVGHAPRGGTSGGVWKGPRDKVVSERGAARETTKGLSRERWFRVKPRPRGAARRNGAQIGRGFCCIEAATEAKEDPVLWKRQQATAQELGDKRPGGAPLEEEDAAWTIQEEKPVLKRQSTGCSEGG